MSPSALLFPFEEAGKNIRRNGLMSIAAFSIVLLAMSVLGGAVYSLYRLHQFAEAQPRQLEMEVFLHADVKREKAMTLREEIAAMTGVEVARLFPKEKAWEEMGNTAVPNGQKLGDVLAGENPLPDRIDVRLKDPSDTDRVSALLRSKSKFPDIHTVRDAREVVQKLIGFEKLVRNIGGAAAVVLFLVTCVVIQNTIRLTIFARRKEIRIMQLVGATPSFIRMPMILEGIIYGAMGAATAAGAVLLAANQISTYAGAYTSPLAQSLPPAIDPFVFLSVLTSVGAVVGLMGSTLSVRRFLKKV